MFQRCFRRIVRSAALHSGHANQQFLRCSPYFTVPALAAVIAEDETEEELSSEFSSAIDESGSDQSSSFSETESTSSDQSHSSHEFRYSSNEWINTQLGRLMQSENMQKLRKVIKQRPEMRDIVHSVHSLIPQSKSDINNSTTSDTDESNTSNESEEKVEESMQPILPRLFDDRPVRIAVIGAGIGGSSCAHFLNESLNDCLMNARGQPFMIDVFDSKEREGGRLLSENLGGFAAERGAGIMIDENRYMFDFTNLLGLRREYRSDTIVGFYNSPKGKLDANYLDTTSILSTLQVLYHYGLINFFKLQSIAKEFICKFGRIYELQSNGEAFDSVWDLYDAMGLADRFEGNGLQWLMKDGLCLYSYSPIVSQLVTGLARANYGQNPENMTPLSLMTSVAPMASGQVWHVKNGNMAIPKALLDRGEKSGSVYKRMNTLVQSITKLSVDSASDSNNHNNDDLGRQFSVQSVNKETGEESTDQYDYVILATPISTSNISFNDISDDNEQFDTLIDFYNDQLYHTTYVYWIRGLLNPGFLGFDEWDFNELSKIGCILHSNTLGRPEGDSTRKSKLNSWQLADGLPRVGLSTSKEITLSDQINNCYSGYHNSERPGIWQAMQTRDEMSEQELNEMYYFIDEKIVSKWKAYPNYQWFMDNWQNRSEEEKKQLLSFVLDQNGLYYINSIECGTSAQEVSVVGAKNIANLIVKQIERLSEEDMMIEELTEMIVGELIEDATDEEQNTQQS